MTVGRSLVGLVLVVGLAGGTALLAWLVVPGTIPDAEPLARTRESASSLLAWVSVFVIPCSIVGVSVAESLSRRGPLTFRLAVGGGALIGALPFAMLGMGAVLFDVLDADYEALPNLLYLIPFTVTALVSGSVAGCGLWLFTFRRSADR